MEVGELKLYLWAGLYPVTPLLCRNSVPLWFLALWPLLEFPLRQLLSSGSSTLTSNSCSSKGSLILMSTKLVYPPQSSEDCDWPPWGQLSFLGKELWNIPWLSVSRSKDAGREGNAHKRVMVYNTLFSGEFSPRLTLLHFSPSLQIFVYNP